MRRDEMIARLDRETFDIIVIGGGASGLGVAVDAASRGYRTLLLEAHDFAKGTSSRSTKLVHGGVRYLEQLNFSLVTEALRERGLLYRNAPHLVANLGLRGAALPLVAGTVLRDRPQALRRARGRPEPRAEPHARPRGHDRRDPERRAGGPGRRHDVPRRAVRRRAHGDPPRAHRGRSRRRADQLHGGGRRSSRPAAARATPAAWWRATAESGTLRRILARVVVNATGIFSDTLRWLDHPMPPR
jgi:glycine/D-amino acid oxidase-like deaminating enzyme